MSVITKEECSSRYNNARQCEQNYLQLKSIIDDISEQTTVNLQGDNENISCVEDEGEK
jgi:hypothetical protein